MHGWRTSAAALGAACVLGTAMEASGQTPAKGYPTRVIRAIVPAAAGGGTDIIARILAGPLTRQLGQNFVVDNRPGAANIIGAELAARSAPDGYTLFMGTTGTFATNPHIYSKLPYSIRDFDPISNVADAPFVLAVHPSLPVRNVGALIALARARPAEIACASFGVGSSSHLALELFRVTTQTRFVHVPYKGSAPGMADVVAGNVSMTFDTVLASVPHIQSGRIRPIGLAALARLDVLRNVPTIDESGLKGYEAGSWYGVMAPAGTPKEIIARLNAEIVKAVKLPEVQDRIAGLGAAVLGTTPEEYGDTIRRDYEKWGKVVREAGIKPE